MLGNDVVDLLDVDARPESFRRRFDERVFAAEERRAIAAEAVHSSEAAESADASDASRSVAPSQTGPLPRAHPHALRWAHWAAKEAAYKLIRQLDPSFVFSPIRLVARFEPARSLLPPRSTTARASDSSSAAAPAPSRERHGRLEIVAGPTPLSPALAAPLALRSYESDELVHVVALRAEGDWSAVTMGIGVMTPTSAGSTGAERVARGGEASAAVRGLAIEALARELEVDAQRLAIGRRGRIPTVELDGRTLPVPLSLSHHGRFVAFAAERTAVSTADGTAASATVGRGISRVRIASVRRTSGEGGGPFASADTAWMVG